MTAPEVGPTDKPTTDLEAIKARCDAATPGPEWVWTYYDGHRALIQYGAPTDEVVLGISDDEPVDPIVLIKYADAEFIAHAREDVPALLDRLEQIAALHHESDGFARGFCSACGTGWPCRTSLIAAPPVPAPVIPGGQRDNTE